MVWLALAACIPNGTIKQPYDCTPVAGPDWETSSADTEGVDDAALERLCRELFREDVWPSVRTLHVLANGRLVAEAAFRDPDDLHRRQHVQSISKSVTSLVVGALVDADVLSLDDEIGGWIPDAFPEEASDHHGVTVQHLLTMTSGIDISNTRFGIQVLMRGQGDSVSWLLEHPSYAPPGEEWYYRDADPHVLAAVVEAATGESFDTTTQRILFEPLGIEDAYVESAPDGTAIAAAGVWIRPRDLARIGQLALDEGSWAGRTVVSPSWILDSTHPHIELEDSSTEGLGYGYYWWTLANEGIYTAWGHGGQYVTVFPEHDLVAVLTAAPYASGDVSVGLEDWLSLLVPLTAGR